MTGIENNSKRIDNLENSFHEMSKRMDGIGAMAAAQASLLQPYGVGKTNITAAVGYYHNANAVAVGLGYRATEHLAFKGSISATDVNQHLSAGAGVSYEF